MVQRPEQLENQSGIFGELRNVVPKANGEDKMARESNQ